MTDQLTGLSLQLGLQFERDEIPWENWNSQWESGFSPTRIAGQILIRASFHPGENFPHEIVIDPKMAFGTGHHATTAMMLEMMLDLDLEDKNVFDFGCGTGVLSIFASQRKARKILALDYDIHSVENTIENCAINHIDNVEVAHGQLNQVTGLWDIILANINRDVIEDSAERILGLLTPGGIMLASGILAQDIEKVKSLYEQKGYSAIREMKSHGWSCIEFNLYKLFE